MNNLTKIVLSLLVMAAVMIYTVLNFLSGKITMVYFLVFMVILLLPFLNMINILIRELRDK